MQSFGSEKGIVIRQPATANLMVDSKDRNATVFSSPWNFQITKAESIQNGFMTRIATTEVVLEWCEPNLNATKNNLNIVVDISHNGVIYQDLNVVLASGFYTVADVVNALTVRLDDLSGTTGVGWLVRTVPGGGAAIESNNGAQIVITQDTTLSLQLGIVSVAGIPQPNWTWDDAIIFNACPDLRLYRYLDFTSSQLTYCQDLKDNSTAPKARDVLCRWYMSFDNPNTLDEYQYPIYMGYTPFALRRLFNPPKQIKWDTNQPVGNLAFQVYTDTGVVAPNLAGVEPGANDESSQWLMTLQLSEN